MIILKVFIGRGNERRLSLHSLLGEVEGLLWQWRRRRMPLSTHLLSGIKHRGRTESLQPHISLCCSNKLVCRVYTRSSNCPVTNANTWKELFTVMLQFVIILKKSLSDNGDVEDTHEIEKHSRGDDEMVSVQLSQVILLNLCRSGLQIQRTLPCQLPTTQSV